MIEYDTKLINNVFDIKEKLNEEDKKIIENLIDSYNGVHAELRNKMAQDIQNEIDYKKYNNIVQQRDNYKDKLQQEKKKTKKLQEAIAEFISE